MNELMTSGVIANDAYKPVLEDYRNAAKNRASFSAQTPEEVATVILHCAQAVHPPLRIRTSEHAEKFTELKTLSDPDGTKLCETITNTMLH